MITKLVCGFAIIFCSFLSCLYGIGMYDGLAFWTENMALAGFLSVLASLLLFGVLLLFCYTVFQTYKSWKCKG